MNVCCQNKIEKLTENWNDPITKLTCGRFPKSGMNEKQMNEKTKNHTNINKSNTIIINRMMIKERARCMSFRSKQSTLKNMRTTNRMWSKRKHQQSRSASLYMEWKWFVYVFFFSCISFCCVEWADPFQILFLLIKRNTITTIRCTNPFIVIFNGNLL